MKRWLSVFLSASIAGLSFGPEVPRAMAQSLSVPNASPGPYSSLNGAASVRVPVRPLPLFVPFGLNSQLVAAGIGPPLSAPKLPPAQAALAAAALSIAAAEPVHAALSASVAPVGHPVRSADSKVPLERALERTSARLAARAQAASPMLEAIAAPGSAGSIHSLGLRIEEWFFRDPSQVASPDGAVEPTGRTRSMASLTPAPATIVGKGSPAGPPKPSAMYGLSALGLSVPLSAWPDIRFWALGGFTLSALILYDLISSGSLSRGTLGFFQRRRLAKNVERDLNELFAFPRERGAPEELRSFLTKFRKSGQEARTELLKEAAQDEELWRHKILAAYMADKSDQSAEATLEVLAQSPHRAKVALDPLILKLLDKEKRKKLSWLDQTAGLRRLSRLGLLLNAKAQETQGVLSELAIHSDSVVRGNALAALKAAQLPLPWRLRKRTWLRYAAALVFATVTLGSLGLTVTAWVKTGEYRQMQEAAALDRLKDRFGEDISIFNPALYTDKKIPEKVLPALMRINRDDPESVRAVEEAMDLLRKSTDSRSDNVLEALLKQIDFLSDRASDTLLTTLMERKSDQIWRFMGKYISENSFNPKNAQRMIHMIQLGSASTDERIFLNLFYFLKSPNPAVRQAAMDSISTSLNDQTRGEFIPRIEGIWQKHGRDPDLNVWTGWFLLTRLNGLGMENVQAYQVNNLLQRIVDGAWAADHGQQQGPQPPPLPLAQPPRPLMARPQPRPQPGQPGQGQPQPPPYTAQVFGMMNQALASAPNGTISPLASSAVRDQYHRIAKNLISESLPLFLDLRARLEKSGVMRRESFRQLPYDHEGPDAVRPNPAYTQGGVIQPMRDAYKLWHLSDYVRDLLASAQELQRTGELDPASPDGRKRLQHFASTRQIVAQMQLAGAGAGIANGNPATERAASAVNDVLYAGHMLFDGWYFVEALQAADLAARKDVPAQQLQNVDLVFRQSYTREELGKLRQFLEELLASGQGFSYSGRRLLTDPEREYLIKSLDRIDVIRGTYYPDPADTKLSKASMGSQLFALRQALAAGDAQALEQAQAALNRSYAESRVKDVFLYRLAAAQAAAGYADNAGFALWTLRFLGQTLASAEGKGLGQNPAHGILDNAFDAAEKAGKAKEAWTILNAALDAARRNGALHPALENMVRSRLNSTARALGQEAEGIFAPQSARRFYQDYLRRVRDAGIRADSGTYRAKFTRYHLRELRAAIDEAYKAWETDKAATPPTEQQKAFRARALETLDLLLQAAEKAGVTEGSAIGTRAADEANQVLLETGAKISPDGTFANALREAGLAPKDSYTGEDIKKLRDFTNALLESGKISNGANGAAKLYDLEQQALAAAHERLDGILARLYPDSAKEKGLGRLVLSLRNPAEAAAAEKAIAKLLDVPEPLFLSRLYGVRTVYAGDAETQAWVLKTLSERLAGPKGAALEAKPVGNLLQDTLSAMTRLGKAEQAWSAIEKSALDAAKQNKGVVPEPLSRQVLIQVRDSMRGLIEQTEAAWADSSDMRGDFVSAGLRVGQWEHRHVYKQKDLEALRKIILDKATATAKAGPLSAGQKQVQEQAERLVPLWLKTGRAAGMLPGDSPGEKAAQEVNATLWRGYQAFSGTGYLKALRQQGLAPEPLDYAVNPETNLKQTYTKKEIESIRDFLKEVLTKGKGWDWSGNPRDLNQDEQAYLRQAIPELEKAVRDYPQPQALPGPAPRMRMPGFAPLMLAGGLFAQVTPQLKEQQDGYFLPAVIGMVLFIGLFFLLRLVFSLLGGSKTIKPEGRTAIPEEILRQRLELLEFAAHSAPTSVLLGAFRSRRAGQGTEYKEPREYQPGDPIQLIDWNAAARSEKIYIKSKLEENDKKVLLLIDASASSGTGTQKTNKWTVNQDVGAFFALLAGRLSLKAGALIFTDQIELTIEPGKLSPQALAYAILAFMPKGKGTDLKKPLEFARDNFHAAAFVKMISDFNGPDFEDALEQLIHRHHDFQPVWVTDPSDLAGIPPIGVMIPVRDAETGKVVLVDPSSGAFQRDQAFLIRRWKDRIKTLFDREEVQELIPLSTNGNHIDELANHLMSKRAR